MREVRVQTGSGKHGQRVTVGSHELVADEPLDVGGADAGPMPHEFLLMGLGACTSMTIKMYAAQKGWPLRAVDVRVRGRHDDARAFIIERDIALDGDLDETQRARLLEMAGKCPVHRTLTGEIRIETKLVSAGS